ncbi:MAG: cytochrome C [Rhodobacteraceae bacterium]|nr:cytochrome C [Paracoccaceae bacterium]
MNRFAATAIVGLLALPAFAEGDPAAGEKEFNKCKSCHMIVADDGTEIVKGGKTGPNLFGIVGRQAGTYPDFRYGDDLVAAGEAGLVWDEEQFLAYVQDPRAYLREFLDDNAAKSKMTFKLRKGGEDVYAYLVSVAPAPTN